MGSNKSVRWFKGQSSAYLEDLFTQYYGLNDGVKSASLVGYVVLTQFIEVHRG